jgi:hypothetical protein
VQQPLNFTGLEQLLAGRGRKGGRRAQTTPDFEGQVLIVGENVVVISPEGQRHTMPLAALWAAVAPPRPDSKGCVHPTCV